MTIAIVIPVYNVTSFLEETLRSVTEQDYPHQDVVVVDDGSAPGHAAEISGICGKFPDITLLQQPHAGAARARHTGVMHTSTENILLLDGDDILLPGALTYLAHALDRHPEAVASYGRLQFVDKNGTILSDPRPPAHLMASGSKLLYMLLEGSLRITNGAVCIRRQALEKALAKNQAFRQGEDWVLWCHLALSGDIVPAGDRVVLHYRRHHQNITATALDDPSLLFAAFDSIFADPAFIAAIGKETLHELQEKFMCRAHAYLASGYAKRSQRQEAMYHLKKGGMFVKALHGAEGEL